MGPLRRCCTPRQDLPLPDFSMPYNVITLTSTVLAFFCGTMLNVLVRKSSARADREQVRDRLTAL